MRKKWTPEEDDFVRANYLTSSCRQMGEDLGRTKSALTARLRTMKLVRTPESQRALGALSWYPPGNIPWIKGKRGIHNSPGTQFKEGSRPGNALTVGTITVRGNYRKGKFYKWIKFGPGEFDWELLQRRVWEQDHAPLKKGEVVTFLDGETMNCSPENLVLENRKTHFRRNANEEKKSKSLLASWARGDYLKSDRWIAFTLFPRDSEMQAEALKQPKLLEIQRIRLRLNRKLKEATT